jgi:NADH-quinone oxidoreductase subunit G
MANEKPTINIDGRDLPYEPGQTVIQIAHENGIDVPHYCYHPGLSIAGNCRICMVEVEGWGKPQIACKLQPAKDMVVKTGSELALAARAGTMEMLLVNHPLDCPICDQAGECHLQDYSYEFGQGEASSSTEKTKLPKNVPFGEKIVYDAERCIKCTLCVRFCQEITDTHELDLAHRGDHEQVIMTSKGEFETPYAMNIIDICPVGALTSRDFRFKSRLWFMDFAPSIDTSCAKGTNITTGGRDGTFLRIEPRYNAAVNQWWMSDAGRLGYKYVNSPTRIDVPHVRGADGALVAEEWDDAILAAAAALKAHPGDVLVDGGCTLEEMFLAQRLAAAIGGKAKFAAATGEADGFLVVAEKGANAKGAEMLGLARAKKAGPASVLVIEREEHVNASMREKSDAVVVFALDAQHVPDSAQVVFPLGSWAERDGLLVNIDGLVQSMERNAGIGPNLASLIELLEEVLGELDPDYDWLGRDGVLEQIRALPAFAGVPFPAGYEAAEVGASS